MICTLLRALVFSLLFTPLIASSASDVIDTSTPEQVIVAFQKLPSYLMFCEDKVRDSADPIKIAAKFEPFLSKELYKLFLWSQCIEPEIPPHYRGRSFNSFMYWDIRFGFHNGAGSDNVKNIRISPAKYQAADKAIIKLVFDPTNYDLNNITTTYTLIREDGQWKIDDIAPKGDPVTKENDGDTVLERSDSIKTDMQNNYNLAMERYKKEQAKQSPSVPASKP